MTLLLVLLVAGWIAAAAVWLDPFLHARYIAAWQRVEEEARRGLDGIYQERDW